MSDCGCKAGKAGKNGAGQSTSQENIGPSIGKGSKLSKIIIFLFAAVLSLVLVVPVMIPLIMVMLWNTIVKGSSTDVTGVLTGIGKFLRTSKKRVPEPEDKEDQEDDEDEEEINPEDYELMGVDVIK
jgi:hypothetical protein